MSSSSRRTSRFSRAGEGVLLALLGLAPLALATAPVWTLWPCALLAGAALVLTLVGARRQGQRLHPPLLAAALALGAVVSALQLVPLSPGLLARVSPRAAEVVDFALLPLGLSPHRPVSLDPPATWREVSKALTALAVLLSATQLARERTARRRLKGAIALGGAGVSLLGLLHLAAGVDALYGFFQFSQARPPLLTPFGNPNHLAGYCGLASTVAVGLALTARERRFQVLWGGAALLAAVGVFASFSRGGVLCWGLGQLLLAALLWQRRRAERASGSESRLLKGAGVLVLLVFGVSAGALYASERLAMEMASAGTAEGLAASKLELWPAFGRAALEFARAGMGRGAFEAAYPRFADRGGETFTHPENIVLQLASELGLPVALLLLGLAVAAFVRVLRRPHLTEADLASLAGVAALCLHNLLDFSLELPAVAFAALVAFGAVCRWERDAEGRGLVLQPRPLLGLALAAGAVLALVPGRSTLREAEREVEDALAAGRPSSEVRALVVAHIDRHPADYALYAQAARALGIEGAQPGEALAFVNRALFLSPFDPNSHLAAARALLRLGRRNQAFLEYRLAFEAGDSAALFKEALPRARVVAELAQLTPERAPVAEQVAGNLVTRGRVPLALEYLQAMHERFAEAPGVERAALYVAEARAHLRAGNKEAASAACELASRMAPDALPTQLARAEVLRAVGRDGEAVTLLERLSVSFPGNTEVGFTLAQHQLARREPRQARAALERISPFLGDLSERARLLELQAQALELEGYPFKALDARKTAARIQPSAGRFHAIARLYERMGRARDALEALREGMRLEPQGGSAQSRAWLARLETAAREKPKGNEETERAARELESLLSAESKSRAAAPSP